MCRVIIEVEGVIPINTVNEDLFQEIRADILNLIPGAKIKISAINTCAIE